MPINQMFVNILLRFLYKAGERFYMGFEWAEPKGSARKRCHEGKYLRAIENRKLIYTM